MDSLKDQFTFDLGGDFFEGLNEDDPQKVEKESEDLFKDGKTPSLIEAIDAIIRRSKNSNLSDDFYKKVKVCTDVVSNVYELTPMQCVLFAVSLEMNNRGNSIDTSVVGKWCYSGDSSSFGTMRLAKDLDVLRERGLIARNVSEGPASYFVPSAVFKAVCDGKPYTSEEDADVSLSQFIVLLNNVLHTKFDAKPLNVVYDRLNDLLRENRHLEFVRKVISYKLSEVDKLILLSCCMVKVYDYPSLSYLDLRSRFGLAESRRIWNTILDGTDALVQGGLVVTELVAPDCVTFKLSQSATEDLLSELGIRQTDSIARPNSRLIQCSTLQEKSMFYGRREQKQIDLLKDALGIESLNGIRKELEARGQRRGFTCLFYGAPGTGKTETAYQLARMTGRDIMPVDISSLRDKWVGESEKNIQAVFDNYRKQCEMSEVMPILLFNEADGVLSKRIQKVEQSTDQLMNTMQNIILQEMEKFDGILIATTNLTGNLDNAFERRFLFKVEFGKPTREARAAIWKSMLPALTDVQAVELASAYDFSGGQIENIARKQTIDAMLAGRPSDSVDMASVTEACDGEKISRNKRGDSIGRIGY